MLQGNVTIDRYFSKTFKPTAQIIADHQPRFNARETDRAEAAAISAALDAEGGEVPVGS